MYIFIQLPICLSPNFTEIFFKCVFLSRCRGLAFQPQRGSCRLWRGLSSSGGSGSGGDPGGPRSVPSPGWPAARPLRPSPGLPPQEGLDGQGDAAAAVLLLALGALPLHHDGGSWESYCRTQRWLLASRRRLLLLLLLLSPTLIPSFPEAEPALSALIPRPSPLPPPLPARGTWLREEGRAGGAAERGGGRSEELSASPPPRPLLAFSTSHCGQRPARAGRAEEQSWGQGEQQQDGPRGPHSALHADPLAPLQPPRIRLPSLRAAPQDCPLSCFPTSASEELSRSREEELWETAEHSLTLASFAPLARRSGVHPWVLAEGAHENY